MNEEEIVVYTRLPDKKCACGKMFFHGCWDNYAWKIRVRQKNKKTYYCSYTCWIKAVRQQEANRRKQDEKKI